MMKDLGLISKLPRIVFPGKTRQPAYRSFKKNFDPARHSPEHHPPAGTLELEEGLVDLGPLPKF